MNNPGWWTNTSGNRPNLSITLADLQAAYEACLAVESELDGFQPIEKILK